MGCKYTDNRLPLTPKIKKGNEPRTASLWIFQCTA